MAVLGIDVAKKKLDVALLQEGKFRSKVVSNDATGYSALVAWVQRWSAEPPHACLESTGTYGEGVATYLADRGWTVSVVNPAQIKAYGESELVRTKTDRADAKLIARFCESRRPRAWQPPPRSVRELQAWVRRLDALLELEGQERNRLDTADAVIRPSIEAVLKALTAEITAIRKRIRDHINQDPDLRQKRDLLDSIPGVGPATIAHILADLADITRFDSAKQVTAFAGLTPKERQSGTSVRGKPRLSKIGHRRLRRALYMPAVVALRHNPVLKAFAERLHNAGKSGKVVVCAAMRKLLHIIYGVLKTQTPFNPQLHRLAS